MSTATIIPSTVDGIKQLATKIKREKAIPHSSALDAASQQAGFESYVHARKALPTRIANRLQAIYLSAHWSEPRSQPRGAGAPRRRAGRELLRVELSRPLTDIVAKHRVAKCRALVTFAMEYADHLECRSLLESQECAREILVRAERSLRFMQATGLQPMSTEVQRAQLSVLDQLPGRDHTSSWFDTKSGAVMLLDEPYSQSIEHRGVTRSAWLCENGFTEIELRWEGLHNPGETVQLLVGRDREFLERVAQAVEGLPRYEIPNPWLLETGLANDPFVSPKRAAVGVQRKPIPNASYSPRHGAVPYSGGFGQRSLWRPAQSMSVDQHMELGRLLRQLDTGKLPEKAYSGLLIHARSRLEDWANHEHRNGDVGFSAYYDQQSLSQFRSKSRTLAALKRAHEIIESGYNDCKPRRELIAAVDAFAAAVTRCQ